MLTHAEARELVALRLPSLASESKCELGIVDAATLERSYGFVFFYQTLQYLETGNPVHALAGNAPILVDRQTGEVALLGTAHPVEHYLSLYAATQGPSGA